MANARVFEDGPEFVFTGLAYESQGCYVAPNGTVDLQGLYLECLESGM